MDNDSSGLGSMDTSSFSTSTDFGSSSVPAEAFDNSPAPDVGTASDPAPAFETSSGSDPEPAAEAGSEDYGSGGDAGREEWSAPPGDDAAGLPPDTQVLMPDGSIMASIDTGPHPVAGPPRRRAARNSGCLVALAPLLLGLAAWAWLGC